jgi:hypothetical protein
MSRKNVVELLKEHSIDNLGTGNSEDRIVQLEEILGIQIPTEYRDFLKEVGYAEIFGDEIYSIYDDYDTPCLGIYQQNKNNKELKNGYLEFFSNDIDGTFYIKLETGEIRLNSTDNLFAKSFNEFLQKIIG